MTSISSLINVIQYYTFESNPHTSLPHHHGRSPCTGLSHFWPRVSSQCHRQTGSGLKLKNMKMEEKDWDTVKICYINQIGNCKLPYCLIHWQKLCWMTEGLKIIAFCIAITITSEPASVLMDSAKYEINWKQESRAGSKWKSQKKTKYVYNIFPARDMKSHNEHSRHGKKTKKRFLFFFQTQIMIYVSVCEWKHF